MPPPISMSRILLLCIASSLILWPQLAVPNLVAPIHSLKAGSPGRLIVRLYLHICSSRIRIAVLERNRGGKENRAYGVAAGRHPAQIALHGERSSCAILNLRCPNTMSCLDFVFEPAQEAPNERIVPLATNGAASERFVTGSML
jgi:hypothetical protein